ncbi:MAG TPA: TlpA disulfide reductase family protein [Capsulimonadaceae bacterium]|jgi:thiol-disulfide isomerase/thioredoxin
MPIQRSSSKSFLSAAAIVAVALAFVPVPAGAAGKRGISAPPADAATVKASIASHKGSIVVVNFWATYCPPCVAEFPSLVKLSQDYRSKGVAVIAVSTDSPRERRTKVEPFLRSRHATFTNFIEHAIDPEAFINAIDPSWQGDLPRTLIYDKHGRLAKILEGEQTYASFAAAVKSLQ